MGAKSSKKSIVAKSKGKAVAKPSAGKKRVVRAKNKSAEKYEQAGAPWWKGYLPG